MGSLLPASGTPNVTKMGARALLLLCTGLPCIITRPQYVEQSGIPQDVYEGLPSQSFYQPEKAPEIPVNIGERRCDNYYDGQTPPCLARPLLPPYSYSTTEGNNGEYRKKRAARTWRAV